MDLGYHLRMGLQSLKATSVPLTLTTLPTGVAYCSSPLSARSCDAILTLPSVAATHLRLPPPYPPALRSFSPPLTLPHFPVPARCHPQNMTPAV